MKSKIAMLVVVGLSLFCLAAFAAAQVGPGNPASPGVAARLALASATDGTPGADFHSGASGNDTVAADAAQIKEAVDLFRRNFELQDADLLKSQSWPSMSPKAYGELKNTFKVLSQITLQENCLGAPVIVSDSAQWTCSERFGYQYDGKPRSSQTHALQFRMKKVEGKWYVEERAMAGK